MNTVLNNRAKEKCERAKNFVHLAKKFPHFRRICLIPLHSKQLCDDECVQLNRDNRVLHLNNVAKLHENNSKPIYMSQM